VSETQPPEMKPAYLIAGSDWPKVDAAITRLRARFAPESIEQLSAGGEEPVDVAAACNALGLFPGSRLVLVRNAEELDDEAVAGIVAYLRAPAPDTTLGLFGGLGFSPKHPLVKAVEGVGEVRLFDAPERKQAADWVVRRFADARTPCPPAVARRLVELVGEDVGDLALETDKLIAYCGGEPPQVEDVERLVIASIDIKPWDITDAWGRRDAAAVVGLATADVERREDVGRVIAQLAAHVRRVHRAAVMLEGGAVQADIARELGLKPYPAQKLVGQAGRFTPAELGRAVVRLAALDLAVKGGSRVDPRFELELALADITAA
jgi:DNA polymerase III subunit delta